jgi:hypothetical protein
MKTSVLATCLVLTCPLLPSSAAADPAPEAPAPEPPTGAQAAPASAHDAECAASFPERLADAKRAYSEHLRYEARFEKSGAQAKLEWFDAHCRFLKPLEIAIRKLDDPNAFVCDPKAKGRPKGLTNYLELAELQPPPFTELQGFRSENYACDESDKKYRIGVILDEERSQLELLEFLCYEDTRPSCVTANETIAKARAKGIR